MPVSEAVDHAVRDCIQNGILEDFMRKNRAEVVKVSIYEYDEEKHFRTLREEGREEGMAAGMEKGKTEIYYHMFHKNKTPEDISDLTGESVEYLYDLQKKISGHSP